jgi:thiamine biosynthesis lipoprotein
MMPAAAAGYRDADVPEGWTALGASVQLVVTDPARLEQGRAMLETELAALDAACNRLRSGSEIAALDARHDSPVRVSPLLAEAIGAALRTARLTDGDVDPTVGDSFRQAGYGSAGYGSGSHDPAGYDPAGYDPAGYGHGAWTGSLAGQDADSFLRPAPGWQQVRLEPRSRLLWLPPGIRLDLGATVRAWAADRCAGRLAGTLGCGVLVGLGGDLSVAGQTPAGGWRIRVQDEGEDPDGPPSGPVTMIAIHDGGLATSSTAARRWHSADPLRYLQDPTTGLLAAPFWRTVSVAAASCAFASAASTVAMIRGRRAKEWLAALRLPARLVTLDGRIHTVAGWPASV